MIAATVIYGITGMLVFAIGIYGAFIHQQLLPRIVALNICGAGVFLVFVTVAYRGLERAPDPVPHALVLTGLVVAVSATALALVLGRRLETDFEPRQETIDDK